MLNLQILPVSHSRKLLVLGLTLAVCETSWSTPHSLYYHLVMFIDSFIFLIILNVFVLYLFFQIVLLAQVLMVIIFYLLH